MTTYSCDPQDQITEILKYLDRPVALIGMMGSGKTQIGRALSTTLNIPFFDADKEIEAAAGSDINGIFEYYGEAAFRDVERRVIRRLAEHKGASILSTGGGAVVDPQTRSLLHENTIMIWLDADVDTLYNRIKNHTDRPLLKTENPRQTLADLLDSRREIYGQAHLTIKSEDVDLSQTLTQLLNALYEYRER